MTVDLDRLREAAEYIDKEWTGELWDASTALRARSVLREAHGAVLDAPVFWKCGASTSNGGFTHAGPCIHGGGWVALVPVKGGQE